MVVKVSVVIPFYNEQENLPLLRKRLQEVFAALASVEGEIVLIDDHSSDGSASYTRAWAAEDVRVKYIRLSRNAGSHIAVSAGLDHCTGDCAILLAADLQDPPETIPHMLEKWQEGYEVVWVACSYRLGESWRTRLFSRMYYWLMRRLALPDMPTKGADFLLMGRKSIDAYKTVREKNTSFLATVLWLGFRQTAIEYVKQPRHAGRSKWNLSKKLKLFVDSIVSFSYAPIRLISLLGALVSMLGFLYAVDIVVSYVFYGTPAQGWPSLMVVILLLSGFQLLMLGVLGEYLWRAFDEARGRPRYIIEDFICSAPMNTSSDRRLSAEDRFRTDSRMPSGIP